MVLGRQCRLVQKVARNIKMANICTKNWAGREFSVDGLGRQCRLVQKVTTSVKVENFCTENWAGK